MTLADGDPAAAPRPAPPPVVSAAYERLTVETPAQTGATPRLALRGDAAALDEAGARVLGELTLTVPASLPTEEADAEASERARRLGATHVLRVSRLDASERVVDRERTRTLRIGQALENWGAPRRCREGDMRACAVQLEPAPVAYKAKARHAVRYVVVAVSPERWDELSPALRPEAR